MAFPPVHLIHVVLVSSASPSASIRSAAALMSALWFPIRRTIGITGSMTIGVTVGMTIGGTIRSVCGLHCPILMNRLFEIQRKGNHQIRISSSLVPENISQLVCEPSIVSNNKFVSTRSKQTVSASWA